MSDEYQDCLDTDERDAPEPERCETCGGLLVLVDTVRTAEYSGWYTQDVYICEQCGAEQRVDVPF